MLANGAHFNNPADVDATFREILSDPTLERDTYTRIERMVTVAEEMLQRGARDHLVEALRQWFASPNDQKLDDGPHIARRIGLTELKPDLDNLRTRIDNGDLDSALDIRSDAMRGHYLRRLDAEIVQMP